MPRAHQEDEREQRQGRIEPREVEDVLEEERRDPERGAVGEDHRPDQDQRRDHGAQQGHQDQHHEHERDRHDEPVVACRRLAQVVLLGGRAADEDVVAAGAMRRLPDSGHEVEARGAVGVLIKRRLELGPGRALLLLGADLGHPGRLGDRVADGVQLRLVGDDDVGRRVGPRREALFNQLLALRRVDVVAEPVAAGQIAVHLGKPEAEHQEQGRGADPDAAGPATDPGGDPAPQAVTSRRCPRCRRAG